jgi:hypothetical protein
VPIVNLIGGLGNQMFQYAAGRALASKRGWEMEFFLGEFKDYKLHNGFELSRIFSVPEIPVGSEVVNALLGWRSNFTIQKVISKLGGRFSGPNLVVEPGFNYWSGLEKIPKHVFIRGYWQSYKYFEAERDLVLKAFTFQPPMDVPNTELIHRMRNTQSVSIHVRRGDYLKSKKNQKIFQICNIDYYMAAIKHLRQYISNPEFFVFTDDQEWVREHLLPAMPALNLVAHNRGSMSHLDMQLMTECKCNVIANSSFSWWGAWLNSNPEKIVIAPKNWFSNGTTTETLLPPNWIQY